MTATNMCSNFCSKWSSLLLKKKKSQSHIMHKQTQPQRPCYIMTGVELSGIRVLEVLNKINYHYSGLKLYVAF